MTIFILDSNFFIQAHRITYPLDVAIGFWDKVKKLTAEHKIVSIDKVRDEIYENNDELRAWLETNIQPEFYQTTQNPAVLSRYTDIVRWVNSRSSHYLQRALDEFLQAENADTWLIAYALSLSGDRKIVTYETSEPNRRNKIKIPDVCQHFGISTVTTIEMFRILGETF